MSSVVAVVGLLLELRALVDESAAAEEEVLELMSESCSIDEKKEKRERG